MLLEVEEQKIKICRKILLTNKNIIMLILLLIVKIIRLIRIIIIRLILVRRNMLGMILYEIYIYFYFYVFMKKIIIFIKLP
jgi:hypothetical protein